MRTVRQVLEDGMTEGRKKRLERLEEMGRVPKVIIAKARELVGETPKINKIEPFADLEVVGFEWKKGRGGKPWAKIMIADGRQLNFFPQAPYGPFIKEAE